MFKKIILLTSCLFISLITFSQDDQKAKELLDQVSEKVKSYDNMEINFSYVQEDDSEYTRQETKGKVTLQGEKYVLELMGTTRIFDGERLYNIIPEDEEVNIARYNPEDDSELSPSKMLHFYEKGYDYEWDITQNDEGRKIQFVKLTPKDKGSEIKEIYLGVDAQTKHIAKMIQIFKDKTKLVVDVKSFKTNQPLSENLFKFNEDKYRGYYINRLD